MNPLDKLIEDKNFIKSRIERYDAMFSAPHSGLRLISGGIGLSLTSSEITEILILLAHNRANLVKDLAAINTKCEAINLLLGS
jgi:hypothetical protein